MATSDESRLARFNDSLHGYGAEPVIQDYQIMLVRVLGEILNRYERDRDYHFIDTKFSIITGLDFDGDDPVRGKRAIYSWIQGRGLEALAGHINFLQDCSMFDAEEAGRLVKLSRKVLNEVFVQMEQLRKLNGGRLFFIMTPQGQALGIDGCGKVIPHDLKPDDPSSFSDLFYVKGMAAAACALGMNVELGESFEWYKRIHRDILDGTFTSDQQQLDPKNIAVKPVAGRSALGPYMIAVGAVALMIRCGADRDFMNMGFELLDHIFGFHTHLDDDSPVSKQYDMWEFVTLQKTPYIDENGMLLSDPGHACEFVGLALGMLEAMEKHFVLNDSERDKVAGYRQVLPAILRRNFTNGFSENGFGICKAFDLVSRKAVNTDMPWWSLPETMRAAALARSQVSAAEKRAFEKIVMQCSSAFLKYYVRADRNLMAVQTLDRDGKPADVIPATPDADPGYHTGLSIIDFLALW